MTPQEAQQIIRESSFSSDSADTPDMATVFAAYEVLQGERQRSPRLRAQAMLDTPRHGNGAPYLPDDAEVLRLHAEGRTHAAIAAELKMDAGTVRYRLRRAGLLIPCEPSREERQANARARWTLALRLEAEGTTGAALARELGVSRERGRQILARAQREHRRLLEAWRSCAGIDQEPTDPSAAPPPYSRSVSSGLSPPPIP